MLWLPRRDLKAENGNEITAAQDYVLQTKYHATKIFKTEKANTDYENNLLRQQTALYEHTQHWQKNNWE